MKFDNNHYTITDSTKSSSLFVSKVISKLKSALVNIFPKEKNNLVTNKRLN